MAPKNLVGGKGRLTQAQAIVAPEVYAQLEREREIRHMTKPELLRLVIDTGLKHLPDPAEQESAA